MLYHTRRPKMEESISRFMVLYNLTFTESYMRFFRTQPFWPQMRPYLQVSQIVITWINDMMSRLQVQPDMSLNLGDLFPNATMLNEVIMAQLSLDETTTVKLITGITLKTDKVSNKSNDSRKLHYGILFYM